MDQPIFSPWLFYFLGMLSSLNVIFGIVLVFSGIGLIITTVVRLVAIAEEDDDKLEKVKPINKNFIWAVVIVVFFGMVVPSKDTVYKMIATSYITPTNINKAVEVGKDFKNEMKKDIFELIDKFNKAPEKQEKK